MANKPPFVGKKVAFGEAFKEVSRGVSKYKQSQYLEEGIHPIVDQGQNAIAGFSNDEEGLFRDVPAIVFGDHTRIVKYAEVPFFAGADGVKILKPLLSSNTRYWYHALRAAKIDNLGYSRHFKLIKEEKFNNPNENEQLQICKNLDAVLKHIELANQIIERLDQLIKSRFVEMFGMPDRRPSGFERSSLERVCNSIVRGPFGSSLKKEIFVPKGDDTYKVYEQKNAIQKNATIGTYYITKDIFESLRRFECLPGDIIMSCSGTMGRLFQLPTNCEQGVINQALCKFSLGEAILSDYFFGFMEQVIDELGAKGSGIKNVSSVKYIKQIKIPVPSLSTQQRFANFVAQVDKSRFIYLAFVYQM